MRAGQEEPVCAPLPVCALALHTVSDQQGPLNLPDGKMGSKPAERCAQGHMAVGSSETLASALSRQEPQQGAGQKRHEITYRTPGWKGWATCTGLLQGVSKRDHIPSAATSETKNAAVSRGDHQGECEPAAAPCPQSSSLCRPNHHQSWTLLRAPSPDEGHQEALQVAQYLLQWGHHPTYSFHLQELSQGESYISGPPALQCGT